MSDADLSLLSDAFEIEPAKLEAVLAIMRRAVREEVRASGVTDARAATPALPSRERAREAEAAPVVLTVADVVARVPWGRSTVDKMVRRRQIHMVKVAGRWTITEERFESAAARGFPVPDGRVSTRRKAA